MDLSAVAKRVYEARKAKNLTQEELQYSELSELLEKQPVDVQKRINRALKAFLEE